MTAALRRLPHPAPARPSALRAVPAPTGAEVALAPVRHGLLDAAGGCRDLDAVLAAARAAQDAGAEAVVVPPAADVAPGRHAWPSTAQALAVLLATSTVRVVVPVEARGDAAVLARFARSATALAGERLVLRVGAGPDADRFAARLRGEWDGVVEVSPR